MAYDTGFSRRSEAERDLQPVAIMSVDPASRTAVGITRNRVSITINCAYGTGDTITTPATGEQWYCERFAMEWRLYGRIPFNDATLSIEPEEGQVSVGSASGPLELNGTEVRANGKVFRLNGVYYRDDGETLQRSVDQVIWEPISAQAAGIIQLLGNALAGVPVTAEVADYLAKLSEEESDTLTAIAAWAAGLGDELGGIWDGFCNSPFFADLRQIGEGDSPLDQVVSGFQSFINDLWTTLFCGFTGDLTPQAALTGVQGLAGFFADNPFIQGLASLLGENAVGNLLLDAVGGATEFLQQLIDALFCDFTGDLTPENILTAITGVLQPLIDNPFLQGLATLADTLGTGVGNLFQDAIAGATGLVDSLFRTLFCDFDGDLTPQDIISHIGDLLQPLIDNPFLQGLATLADTLGTGVGNLAADAISGATGLVDGIFRAVFCDFEGDLTPQDIIGHIGDVFEPLINNPFIQGLSALADALGTGVGNLAADAISGATGLVQAIFGAIFCDFDGSFTPQTMIAKLGEVLTGITANPFVAGLISFAEGLGHTVGGGIEKAFAGANELLEALFGIFFCDNDGVPTPQVLVDSIGGVMDFIRTNPLIVGLVDFIEAAGTTSTGFLQKALEGAFAFFNEIVNTLFCNLPGTPTPTQIMASLTAIIGSVTDNPYVAMLRALATHLGDTSTNLIQQTLAGVTGVFDWVIDLLNTFFPLLDWDALKTLDFPDLMTGLISDLNPLAFLTEGKLNLNWLPDIGVGLITDLSSYLQTNIIGPIVGAVTGGLTATLTGLTDFFGDLGGSAGTLIGRVIERLSTLILGSATASLGTFFTNLRTLFTGVDFFPTTGAFSIAASASAIITNLLNQATGVSLLDGLIPDLGIGKISNLVEYLTGSAVGNVQTFFANLRSFFTGGLTTGGINFLSGSFNPVAALNTFLTTVLGQATATISDTLIPLLDVSKIENLVKALTGQTITGTLSDGLEAVQSFFSGFSGFNPVTGANNLVNQIVEKITGSSGPLADLSDFFDGFIGSGSLLDQVVNAMTGVGTFASGPLATLRSLFAGVTTTGGTIIDQVVGSLGDFASSLDIAAMVSKITGISIGGLNADPLIDLDNFFAGFATFAGTSTTLLNQVLTQAGSNIAALVSKMTGIPEAALTDPLGTLDNFFDGFDVFGGLSTSGNTLVNQIVKRILGGDGSLKTLTDLGTFFTNLRGVFGFGGATGALNFSVATAITNLISGINSSVTQIAKTAIAALDINQISNLVKYITGSDTNTPATVQTFFAGLTGNPVAATASSLVSQFSKAITGKTSGIGSLSEIGSFLGISAGNLLAFDGTNSLISQIVAKVTGDSAFKTLTDLGTFFTNLRSFFGTTINFKTGFAAADAVNKFITDVLNTASTGKISQTVLGIIDIGKINNLIFTLTGKADGIATDLGTFFTNLRGMFGGTANLIPAGAFDPIAVANTFITNILSSASNTLTSLIPAHALSAIPIAQINNLISTLTGGTSLVEFTNFFTNLRKFLGIGTTAGVFNFLVAPGSFSLPNALNSFFSTVLNQATTFLPGGVIPDLGIGKITGLVSTLTGGASTTELGTFFTNLRTMLNIGTGVGQINLLAAQTTDALRNALFAIITGANDSLNTLITQTGLRGWLGAANLTELGNFFTNLRKFLNVGTVGTDVVNFLVAPGSFSVTTAVDGFIKNILNTASAGLIQPAKILGSLTGTTLATDLVNRPLLTDLRTWLTTNNPAATEDVQRFFTNLRAVTGLGATTLTGSVLTGATLTSAQDALFGVVTGRNSALNTLITQTGLRGWLGAADLTELGNFFTNLTKFFKIADFKLDPNNPTTGFNIGTVAGKFIKDFLNVATVGTAGALIDPAKILGSVTGTTLVTELTDRLKTVDLTGWLTGTAIDTSPAAQKFFHNLRGILGNPALTGSVLDATAITAARKTIHDFVKTINDTQTDTVKWVTQTGLNVGLNTRAAIDAVVQAITGVVGATTLTTIEDLFFGISGMTGSSLLNKFTTAITGGLVPISEFFGGLTGVATTANSLVHKITLKIIGGTGVKSLDNLGDFFGGFSASPAATLIGRIVDHVTGLITNGLSLTNFFSGFNASAASATGLASQLSKAITGKNTSITPLDDIANFLGLGVAATGGVAAFTGSNTLINQLVTRITGTGTTLTNLEAFATNLRNFLGFNPFGEFTTVTNAISSFIAKINSVTPTTLISSNILAALDVSKIDNLVKFITGSDTNNASTLQGFFSGFGAYADTTATSLAGQLVSRITGTGTTLAHLGTFATNLQNFLGFNPFTIADLTVPANLITAVNSFFTKINTITPATLLNQNLLGNINIGKISSLIGYITDTGTAPGDVQTFFTQLRNFLNFNPFNIGDLSVAGAPLNTAVSALFGKLNAATTLTTLFDLTKVGNSATSLVNYITGSTTNTAATLQNFFAGLGNGGTLSSTSLLGQIVSNITGGAGVSLVNLKKFADNLKSFLNFNPFDYADLTSAANLNPAISAFFTRLNSATSLTTLFDIGKIGSGTTTLTGLVTGGAVTLQNFFSGLGNGTAATSTSLASKLSEALTGKANSIDPLGDIGKFLGLTSGFGGVTAFTGANSLVNQIVGKITETGTTLTDLGNFATNLKTFLGGTNFLTSTAAFATGLPALLNNFTKSFIHGNTAKLLNSYLIGIVGTPNGGSFRLAYGSQTTAAITWNATPATLAASIQSALTALTNIGAGGAAATVNTVATGGSIVGIDVRIDNLIAPLTLSSNNLTVASGALPVISVAQQTDTAFIPVLDVTKVGNLIKLVTGLDTNTATTLQNFFAGLGNDATVTSGSLVGKIVSNITGSTGVNLNDLKKFSDNLQSFLGFNPFSYADLTSAANVTAAFNAFIGKINNATLGTLLIPAKILGQAGAGTTLLTDLNARLKSDDLLTWMTNAAVAGSGDIQKFFSNLKGVLGLSSISLTGGLLTGTPLKDAQVALHGIIRTINADPLIINKLATQAVVDTKATITTLVQAITGSTGELTKVTDFFTNLRSFLGFNPFDFTTLTLTNAANSFFTNLNTVIPATKLDPAKLLQTVPLTQISNLVKYVTGSDTNSPEVMRTFFAGLGPTGGTISSTSLANLLADAITGRGTGTTPLADIKTFLGIGAAGSTALFNPYAGTAATTLLSQLVTRITGVTNLNSLSHLQQFFTNIRGLFPNVGLAAGAMNITTAANDLIDTVLKSASTANLGGLLTTLEATGVGLAESIAQAVITAIRGVPFVGGGLAAALEGFVNGVVKMTRSSAQSGTSLLVDPKVGSPGFWNQTGLAINTNPALSRSTPQSLELTSAGATARGFDWTVDDLGAVQPIIAREADVFYAECWAYSPSTNANAATISLHGKAVNLASGAQTDIVPEIQNNETVLALTKAEEKGAWYRLAGYFRMPSGYDGFKAGITLPAGATTSGNKFYFDDLVAQETTRPQSINNDLTDLANYTISNVVAPQSRNPTWVCRYPVADVVYPEYLNARMSVFGTTDGITSGSVTAHTHNLSGSNAYATIPGSACTQYESRGAYITVSDSTTMDTVGMIVWRSAATPVSANSIFMEVFKENDGGSLTMVESFDITSQLSTTGNAMAFIEKTITGGLVVQAGERYMVRVRNQSTLAATVFIMGLTSTQVMDSRGNFGVTSATTTNSATRATLNAQTSYTTVEASSAQQNGTITAWGMLAATGAVASNQWFSDQFNRTSLGSLWTTLSSTTTHKIELADGRTRPSGTVTAAGGRQAAIYTRRTASNGQRVDGYIARGTVNSLEIGGNQSGGLLMHCSIGGGQVVHLAVDENGSRIQIGAWNSLSTVASSAIKGAGNWSMYYNESLDRYVVLKNDQPTGLFWNRAGSGLVQVGRDYRFGGILHNRSIESLVFVNASGTIDNWTLRDWI